MNLEKSFSRRGIWMLGRRSGPEGPPGRYMPYRFLRTNFAVWLLAFRFLRAV